MLADLLIAPQNELEWSRWSFAHRDQHNLIRQAIQKLYGVNLPDYQLDPINFADFTSFLDNNQSAHNDMNGVLGLQSSNLEQVDFQNKAQLEAWIYLHRREHEAAAFKLGIS